MTKLAISYAGYYGQTFEAAVEDAAKRGFAAVQLIPDQTPNLCEELTPPRRRNLREMCGRMNVEPSLHNVFYDINLTSLVPAVAAAALSITRQVFEVACDIGATSVVVHPGYMFPGWRHDSAQRERFFASAEQSLRRLADVAESLGLTVLLENGSYHLTTYDRTPPVPLHLAITPRELGDLVQMTGSRMGVCLDVNKAFRSGYPAEEFINTVGAHIQQIQLSTIRERWPMIEPVLTRLRADGFSGMVVLEGSRTETEQGVALLRDLLGGA